MAQRKPIIPLRQVKELVMLVRRLRRECPWDREQTHRSLRHSLIEETYEVIEALDENSLDKLREELGDVLLHVVMQATIAEEAGEFTFKDVVDAISAKLVARHPHVFGSLQVKDAREVKRNWERLKMSEGRISALQGVPKGMPALQRAQRIQERAARVGFDWKRSEDVWDKVLEEAEELRAALRARTRKRREEELGDYLFALVNYARFVGVNPETALRRTTEKFIRRFHYIERGLRKRGKDVHGSTLEEMDELWDDAKRRSFESR
jgi:MazG family protein